MEAIKSQDYFIIVIIFVGLLWEAFLPVLRTLSSGVTPGRTHVAIDCDGIEFWLAAYKASTLHEVLLF